MTPEKVLSVIAEYEKQLISRSVIKRRINSKRSGPFTEEEMLSHAHYLIDGIREYVKNPGQWGKTNRHLASVQMLLWQSGWYTLEDLMNHNRP